MNISVIGTGYVGLTTGLVLAHLGNNVVCIDIDKAKIEKLKKGFLSIYEPGMKELFEIVNDKITFTDSYEEAMKDAEVIFIAVGTPSNADGTANSEFIIQAATSIGKNLSKEEIIVVNKSTAPIGSGNWIETIIYNEYKKKNASKSGCKVHVVSNPEFLKQGDAIYDTFYPDRIIIGANNQYAISQMLLIYNPIVYRSFVPLPFLKDAAGREPVSLITTDLISAELIKYSSNAFLSLKISFINEIADVCEKVGADVMQIAKGIGYDQRIGPKFLNAGIGWGGSCFGKDTAALIATARDYGLNLNIIEASRKVNYSLRDKVVDRIQEKLKILKGRTVSLMGLAFKPNTDDLRDAPAVDIAKSLLKEV